MWADWAPSLNALAKAGIELGENGSIFPRPKGKPVSDDQRSRHSLTVEYNQAIPSPIAINATENFKDEFVTKASYSIAPPAKINATASAQASGSLTIP